MKRLAIFVVAALSIVALAEDKPIFTAGQETKVTDAKTGGLGWYVVWLPQNYTTAHEWPIIFNYHGVGQDPKVLPMKEITGGRNFIVVGMEYLNRELGKQVPKDEVANLLRIRDELSKSLKVDLKQQVMAGFSQGGWQTSIFSELKPDDWNAIVILGAGKQSPGTKFKGKPIYIGVGADDGNKAAAEKAADMYKKGGNDVTLEIYPGIGHAANTEDKKLGAWLLEHGPLRNVKPQLQAAQQDEKAGRLGAAFNGYTALAALSEAGDPATLAAAALKALSDAADKKMAEAEDAVTQKKFDDALKLLNAFARTYANSPLAEKAAARIKEVQQLAKK